MSAQQIERFGLLARLFTRPEPLVTDERATGLRLYPERGRTVHAEGIPTNAGHRSGRTVARLNPTGGNPDGTRRTV